MVTKVILNKSIEGLGKAAQIVSVKDGYARNYLLPKKIAVKWTKKAEEAIVLLEKNRKNRTASLLEKAKANKEIIESITLQIPQKVTKTNTLYGALSEKTVAEHICSNTKINVSPSMVHFSEPIKAVGHYLVSLKLHDEVDSQIKVEVVAE